MNRESNIPLSIIVNLVVFMHLGMSHPVGATSLAAHPLSSETAGQESPKDAVINTYIGSCRTTPMKKAECERIAPQAIDTLKEDLRTLGSSANPFYLPTILPIFQSDESELRIAAADAVGMIGPTESIFPALTILANDPVPDVRKAASHMLQHGKEPALALLARRTAASVRTGRTPDTPPNLKTIGIPIPPDSQYLFFASDVTQGRLAYVTKTDTKANLAFFKPKAKKGPLELTAFQELYDQALSDEQQAREQANQETMTKMFSQQPPKDPTKMDAYLKQMEQAQSALAAQNTFQSDELYSPDIYGSPKVVILEERKIGQRNYPTKYVVLYEDRALNRPGIRLCWLAVPDQVIKTTQMTSAMKDILEQLPPQEHDIPPIIKEKSEKEQKQFKQEQRDLEKELGL